MTKGRVTLPGRAVAGRKPIFITSGGPQARDLPGRDAKFVVQLAAQNEQIMPNRNLNGRPIHVPLQLSSGLRF
jgi:hypothetical protein